MRRTKLSSAEADVTRLRRPEITGSTAVTSFFFAINFALIRGSRGARGRSAIPMYLLWRGNVSGTLEWAMEMASVSPAVMARATPSRLPTASAHCTSTSAGSLTCGWWWTSPTTDNGPMAVAVRGPAGGRGGGRTGEKDDHWLVVAKQNKWKLITECWVRGPIQYSTIQYTTTGAVKGANGPQQVLLEGKTTKKKRLL